MKQYIDIKYRDIAKMLAKALPVEGERFTQAVESRLEAIKALPKEAKIALKSAYIFSSKVPREEREDFFQDLALTLLKAKVDSEKLAYSIARCDWVDWWRKYKVKAHYSLDSVVDDGEGNQTTLGELLVGESEFEIKMDGKLEAERIWDLLPNAIKYIVQRRLLGYALNKNDRECLERWSAKNAMLLVS